MVTYDPSHYSQPVSMDHNKPVIVPVGSDALGQIGGCGLHFHWSVYFDDVINDDRCSNDGQWRKLGPIECKVREKCAPVGGVMYN